VLARTVARTSQGRAREARFARRLRALARFSFAASVRAEQMPLKPIANRRLAAPQLASDLSDRHFARDERPQLLSRQATPSGMTIEIDRSQPMLPNPVPDRRFMPANAPSNLSER
jgi:hypothetical protein